ncbi:putative multiheme cytochrome c [Thermincola ferriacetica]|uniref:Putative multiheme cytochrome c n=1 Tax=Thermincola ferriacetica TaxID=281456 RepID=A0A0L6W6C0_9FIRM|nr:hypothetical protein [Thermincola ferriacetica]KNZ71006.1 putative multiheme cytochrome c [Thermincola ferriacetica]
MRKYLFLVSMALGIYLFSFGGFAGAVSGDCSKCHGDLVTSFELDAPNPELTCAVCHNHYAMNAKHPYPNWTAQYVTGIGYFKSADSVLTGPPAIHNYHNGSNTPAGTNSCGKCHRAVKCESCHQNVKHKQHGSSEITSFPAYVVADGKAYASQQLSCAASNCHRFYSPGIVRTNSNGTQLCVNCHSTDKSGHNETNLGPLHDSFSSTLNIGVTNYQVSCEGCHAATLSAEHKKAAGRLGQPEDNECGYCHGASAQSTVAAEVSDIKTANAQIKDPKLKAENRGCVKCHFNIAVLPARPSEHLTYHIAVNSNNLSVVGGPHKDCNTCHANVKLFSTISNLARTPIDQRKYDCFVCHNQQFNLAPVHKAGLDGQLSDVNEVHYGCNTCHTPGTKPSEKVAQIIDELKNGAEGYECVDCHTGDVLDAGHAGKIDANCTKTCHKSSLTEEHLNNPVTQANNQDNPLTCNTCHANPDVKFVIAIGDTDCAACHYHAHNLNIVQQVPANIPLYPGFEWSTPQNAEIWLGEPWFDVTYQANSKRIVSNRRSDVNSEQIKDFYLTNMTTLGWMSLSEETINRTIILKFNSGKRYASVMIYDSEVPEGQTTVPAGIKIDIFYK